jgi:endoglucanase
MFSVLKDIVDRPGVTGFEDQRRSRIVEYFSKHCDSVSVDVIGNVIGTLGSGERSVMLAGHYDQIGFMIKYVDEKGYAYISQVGGWDPRTVYGTRVKIWTGDAPDSYVIGTIGAKAAHLIERESRDKAVRLEDMRVDFGAKNGEEAKSWGVKPGGIMTVDSSVSRLGNVGGEGDLVVGAGFDDACAVVSLIRALELLGENPPKKLKVYAVATVQEEIGLRGAQVSGFNIAPWCAIASDVTHAQAPGVEPSAIGDIKLGGGPVIGVGANFTKELWSLMEEVAEKEGIPRQMEAVPAASGTDAWTLQVLRGGTITGLVSIPNRYMHSPNEVISLKDLENTGKLLAATMKALEERDIQHTREVYRKR